MPPRRKTTRAAQLQPQAAQSDYDTDTANLTDYHQPAAPPPTRTNAELNLAVLKRHDYEIEQIVSVAPFAVVYLFSTETQQWEKCGIEGTLFVCQLHTTSYERYNVIILNRKGLDNFTTELLSGDDVDITDPFVILQVTAEDGTPQIYGLWIFSEPPPSSTATTREVNALIIQECANRAQKSRETHGYGMDGVVEIEQSKPMPPVSSHIAQDTATSYVTMGRQVDLLELFGKS